MEKYLEFEEGSSHKFWQITLDGDSFTVTYGKVGTAGQTQTKSFADEATAEKEAMKLLNSKLKKGYAEAGAPAVTAKPAAAKSKAEAKPIEAPKPKAHTLPEAGPDVKTDNGPKVANPNDSDDGYYTEHFDLARLRTPEVAKEQSKAVIPKVSEAKDESFGGEAFIAAGKELVQAVMRGRGASALELVASLKKVKPSDEQLKDIYEKVAKRIFSGDVSDVSLQALDMLPVIAEAGVNIAEIANDADEYDVHPLFMKIAKSKAAVDDTVTEFYRPIADIAIKQLQEVVSAIKAGTHERIDGNRLPDGETGLSIDADDPICIKTTIAWTRLARQDYELAADIKGAVHKHYLTPIIKPMLEKMMNEGLFDDIAANGYMHIGLDYDSEPIVERRIDEKALAEAAKALEADLAKLETTDFKGSADALKKTIKLYCKPNGIIVNKDTDRIIALLKRCLYSGEEAFEEAARDLINGYDKLDYGTWRHTFISYIWDNFDYDWAKDAMQRMADEGYQNARDTLRIWNDGAAPASSDDDGESIDSVALSENDIFIETDTIIARAFSDGWIYLRFLEESERGYSDALDWLNKLMAAGYSKAHDGYELRVYFLAEPVFFEELRPLMDEYLWPDCDSHAFFCKAVCYPALHDKVAEFARLTLKLYDHYLDLDGEFSTVAGTFAAVAVSMADTKYMDVATQFALETDGEHEELASQFADILTDYWGVTPKTAVAIAMLRLSYDHDDLGLSDDFWKYPQNLEPLTEYFTSANMPHKEHKICRLANNLFEDGENAIKKLKKLFKDASDAKAAYADFHNMLLEALESEGGDDYGKPIDYKAPTEKALQKSTSAFKELPENPPCVISMAEAKKRGIEMDDTEGWCTFTFAPIVITNPYIYDFFIANQEARNKNCKSGNYTFWNPCVICTFKNKVAVDLRGAPYQYGMMIFDKKDVAVLYGIFDYAKLIVKIQDKKIDRAQLEALRDEFIAMDCPQGPPVNGMDNPAVVLLDNARDAIYAERYLRATKKLEKIKPEDGEVYDAALIVMADLMTKKGDKAALKRIYTEAAQRMPQHKAYWDEKLK